MPHDVTAPDRSMAILDKIEDTAILTLTNPTLSGPDVAMRMRELLVNVRSQGSRHLILDLQNVVAMDSCCVGVLIEMLTEMQQSETGGRIALVNAGGNVEYLFRITRLDRVFPICRDVMSALTRIESVEEETPGKKRKKRK